MKTKTSLEISEITGKNHKDVMRDIRNRIEHGVTLDDFKLSTYKDKCNRSRPMYILNTEGVAALNSNYHNEELSELTGHALVKTTRFELSFGELLNDVLNTMNIKIINQYNIDNKYRIDFYLPEYNLAIEYDESQHMSQVVADNDRMDYITNKIGCKWLRLDYKTKNSINLGLTINEILKL